MPGPFNLDHIHPLKPLLFPKFSNFLTFILGGQFLLPQRANYGKRGFIQPHKRKRQKVCPAQFQSRHIATKGASGATFGEISVQELRAIIIWHWKASPWRCSSECGRAEERTRTLADTLKGIRKRSEVTNAKMVSFRF